MSTHLTTDPHATGAAVFPTRPEWLTLSAAIADEVPVIADRNDLVVSVAPGAGSGAPACFYPARALIEIDGDHLGVDPATVDPANLSDRSRYAPTWGALTHECGHAKHTAWEPPPDAPPGVVAAAMLLEEPRMEAAQVRRRPDDRHWLRACVKGIVAADLHLFADPATAPQMTKADAARAAALLLGRADGGVLTRAEVAPVARVVRDVLGEDALDKLRAVWRKALRTADDDGETMLDLGRQWCEITGTDPDTGKPAPGAAPDPSGGTTGTEGGPATPPPVGGTPSPLAGAITAVLDKVARKTAREKPPQDPAAVAAAAKAREAAAGNVARTAARAVFDAGGPDDGATTTTAGTRPPTPQERSAARVLARALDTAGLRERVTVKSTSDVPPGRLRMRGVRASEAQRAAGATVTAEPFTRVTRTPVPTPPLRLGVACDVSGSMGWVRDHVASATWILADAARHTRVPADTASVIFGNRVRPLTHPGKHPAHVTEFHTLDNWEDIPTALDALDGALGLSHPGAARLLVVVSDGRFPDQPRRDGQRKLDRMRAAGCAVLWLTISDYDTPLDGAIVRRIEVHDPKSATRPDGTATTWCLCGWTSPATTRPQATVLVQQHRDTTPPITATARIIGRAATAALRAAR
ncbi:vWA domain-containing protein [Saccharothrix luteola]|uniref:vWA domain-containing protein n=1 Tax=Saccharothrix luteola TaxID=2893018 RepID=UPI001E4A4246|nr:vWA domain-containing protein [Saccharothrix luteola]MCC8245025.1 VWA domain-containing protein [Saccharothrix luteola]